VHCIPFVREAKTGARRARDSQLQTRGGTRKQYTVRASRDRDPSNRGLTDRTRVHGGKQSNSARSAVMRGNCPGPCAHTPGTRVKQAYRGSISLGGGQGVPPNKGLQPGAQASVVAQNGKTNFHVAVGSWPRCGERLQPTPSSSTDASLPVGATATGIQVSPYASTTRGVAFALYARGPGQSWKPNPRDSVSSTERHTPIGKPSCVQCCA
jgi:hypothetical protein